MDRDLRQTPLFSEIETFCRTALEPGFGRPTTFGDPVPSPDGCWVAFTGYVRTSMEGFPQGRLFLVAADGSSPPRQLTFGPHDDTEPRWAPDGSRLTFRSDRLSPGRFQLYELAVADVGEARPLATLAGVVEHHRWSPDGSRILMVVAGASAEQADALGSGSLAPVDDLPSWIPEVSTAEAEDEWRVLWVLDVARGEATRCSREGLNVWEATWLGDDRAAAIVSEAPGEGAWYSAPLAVIDLASGQERTLLRSTVQLGYAEGSPDGRTIAVLRAVASDRYIVAGDLVLVDAATGDGTTIGTSGVDVSSAAWQPDGSLLVCGLRGMRVVALSVAADRTVTEVLDTDLSLGELMPYVAAVGDALVAVGSSAERPQSMLRLNGEDTHVLADSRHAGTEALRGGWRESRVLTWSAPDGQEIQGRVITPKAEPPYALLVNVHGGPVGQFTNDWPYLYEQVLLARGYAILYPNPRGSTGRGQEFAAAVVGDMGGADSYDILAGIDRLVDDGLVDPERVGIFGGSYGGFMAAWLPTIDARFKAAVALSPVTDWYSEHFGSSLIDWVSTFLDDSPENVGGAYHQRSPVLAGDRLRTPTLLTAGLRDRATPAGQAVEHFRALVAAGVPAEVVVYPQEGHGVRSMSAQLDLYTRMVAWFERFMPPA